MRRKFIFGGPACGHGSSGPMVAAAARAWLAHEREVSKARRKAYVDAQNRTAAAAIATAAALPPPRPGADFKPPERAPAPYRDYFARWHPSRPGF